MGNDKRCTLRHDPINADRDIPCWYCIHYGHISEPRVSRDMRNEDASRERAMRKAQPTVRRNGVSLGKVSHRSAPLPGLDLTVAVREAIEDRNRRIKLIEEILRVKAENAALRKQ